jgi:site-specific recombinase XerD
MKSDDSKKYRGVFEKVPGSGVWWIQYWGADGQRHREKAGRLKFAQDLVEKRRTEKREGKKMPKLNARPKLFGELTDAALKYSEPGDKGANHSRMKALKAEFGNMPAEEIKPAEIRDWLDEHEEWTVATRNRFLALMKLTYRLAEERQLIKYNPARLVRQQTENNARIRFLTDEEETALRAHIPAQYLPEFEIGLHTGMRKSEQYEKAVWENVDFLNNLLKIPDPKHRDARYVRLNSRVQAVLKMLKPEVVKGRIMGTQDNKHWFNPAVEKAKLQGVTWHILRHTFISRLVMKGIDIRTVQELAGHKTIQMTMRYAHLAPSHVQQAVERLVAPTATTTATEQKSSQKEQQVSIQ